MQRVYGRLVAERLRAFSLRFVSHDVRYVERLGPRRSFSPAMTCAPATGCVRTGTGCRTAAWSELSGAMCFVCNALSLPVAGVLTTGRIRRNPASGYLEVSATLQEPRQCVASPSLRVRPALLQTRRGLGSSEQRAALSAGKEPMRAKCEADFLGPYPATGASAENLGATAFDSGETEPCVTRTTSCSIQQSCCIVLYCILLLLYCNSP